MMDSEFKEIPLEDTVPFRHHLGRTYEGARLQQLMDSIERIGLVSAITVRPTDNDKYEILCGHNRVNAAKALGYETIRADIRYGLSDDAALELFFDSNLNQQSFSDWSYAQRFEAVKYSEKLIRESSRQGRRTDLERKTSADTKDGTCVQTRQKLIEDSNRTTARDKMARQLGLSTATFSKYRRIIKLPNDMVQSIAGLLGEKRITFEAAYIISGKRVRDMEYLLKEIWRHPDKKIDLDSLKELPPHDADAENGTIYPVSKKQVLKVLKDSRPSDTIAPTRRKKKEGTAPQQVAGK